MRFSYGFGQIGFRFGQRKGVSQINFIYSLRARFVRDDSL